MHTSRTKLSLAVRLLILALAMILTLGSVACTTNDPNTSDPTDTTVSDTEAITEKETDANTETDAETKTEAETEAPTVTYTITAVDQDGAPLSGVTVQLCKGDVCLLPQTTGEDGTVSFVKDQPDDYTVKAFKNGYVSEEKYLFEAGATTLTVTLQKSPEATAFTVSNVFSDNMVLQRNEHVRIWGWADESQNGRWVSAEFLGSKAETVIENGEWVITFEETWEANTTDDLTLTVSGDGISYTFTDVLVGDVYMIVGQSNVQYSFSDLHGSTSLPVTEHDLIRLHYNTVIHYDQAVKLGKTDTYPAYGTDEVARELPNGASWQFAVEEYINPFSALGYCFAKEMLKATNDTVPVGVIEVAASGRALGAFLPNQVEEANATGSCFMYNAFMYPFEQYAIAGLIWYQGESDLELPAAQKYTARFAAMVEHMRATHNIVNPEFPVYIMEFPTIFAASTFPYGVIRGVVSSLPLTVPNSYVVAACDLSGSSQADPGVQLHPPIKHTQAKRLCGIAKVVMGLSNASMDEVAGPRLVSAVWASEDKKTVILTYENVGEGLRTIDGAELVKGFVNARSSFQLMPNATVEARITAPNQITLTSALRIECVSYHAVTEYFYGINLNLCNSYLCPATAAMVPVTEADTDTP